MWSTLSVRAGILCLILASGWTSAALGSEIDPQTNAQAGPTIRRAGRGASSSLREEAGLGKNRFATFQLSPQAGVETKPLLIDSVWGLHRILGLEASQRGGRQFKAQAKCELSKR